VQPLDIGNRCRVLLPALPNGEWCTHASATTTGRHSCSQGRRREPGLKRNGAGALSLCRNNRLDALLNNRSSLLSPAATMAVHITNGLRNSKRTPALFDCRTLKLRWLQIQIMLVHSQNEQSVLRLINSPGQIPDARRL
jgi:hypothetical protein